MTERDTKRESDIIAEAKKRLKERRDAEAEMRQKCLDDLEFLSASPDNAEAQWGSAAVAERARTGRPALVVNRLDQFVQHIANSQRQNRVSARVFPVDDKADKETAKVYQGSLRHIENNSGGTLAYDTAEFYAVAMGFGYFFHKTEHCDPHSFEQDIKIEPIKNPFQVYLGPHDRPDGSDAEFGFILHTYTFEEYEAEFGTDPKSFEPEECWVGENEVTVAAYYTIEWRDDVLVLLRDGRKGLLSELGEVDEAQIVRRRETEIPTCKYYLLNSEEILSETDWIIPKIPIIKVTGHELNVHGKTILKGIVRNLKDAQRMFNKAVSDEAELLDSSKSQVVIADGQEEGHEQQFKTLNKMQTVKYKPTTVEGHLVPGPTRLPPNMSLAAAGQVRLMLSDDLKALAGLYDAALGRQSNEKSGKAILARQQQSDVANFHFQDNLTLSITHSTRMLVEAIPVVYDTQRVMRIIGEDDSQKVVVVNAQWQEAWRKHGQDRGYDLKTGKYDVVCTAGPSFSTKRQEAAELLTTLAGSVPLIMQVAPDIVMQAIDVPYGQEISERMKKALPPELQEQQGEQQIPPQVQKQLAETGKMVELLTQELNAKTEVIKTEQAKYEAQARIKQLEIASNEKIEMHRINLEARQTQADLDSKEAIAHLKATVEAMKAQMNFDSAKAARDSEQFASTVAEGG